MLCNFPKLKISTSRRTLEEIRLLKQKVVYFSLSSHK